MNITHLLRMISHISGLQGGGGLGVAVGMGVGVGAIHSVEFQLSAVSLQGSIRPLGSLQSLLKLLSQTPVIIMRNV